MAEVAPTSKAESSRIETGCRNCGVSPDLLVGFCLRFFFGSRFALALSLSLFNECSVRIEYACHVSLNASVARCSRRAVAACAVKKTAGIAGKTKIFDRRVDTECLDGGSVVIFMVFTSMIVRSASMRTVIRVS